MAKGPTIRRRRIRDLPPYQRLQALERAKQIADGTLKVPSRCPHCRGTILTSEWGFPGEVVCGSCGRRSDLKDVTAIRRREIQAVILDGPLEEK